MAGYSVFFRCSSSSFTQIDEILTDLSKTHVFILLQLGIPQLGGHR